jgi:hypothetical protein
MTFQKLDLFPSSGKGGGEDTYSVGPLRKNRWATPVRFTQLFNLQANFAGDNKKVYNKSCDKACTCMELG